MTETDSDSCHTCAALQAWFSVFRKECAPTKCVLHEVLNPEPVADGQYLVLLDFKYTLVDYRWEGHDYSFSMWLRPYASELICMLLQQQLVGKCQLGFYTPLSSEYAIKVAEFVLREATGLQWKRANDCSREMLPTTTFDGAFPSVWLFDEGFIEHHPISASSGNPMHIKSVDKVLSANEGLGNQFYRPSTVYVTCSYEWMDDNGRENILKVHAWEMNNSGDQNLEILSSYLQSMFRTRPMDARRYLKYSIFVQLKTASPAPLCKGAEIRDSHP